MRNGRAVWFEPKGKEGRWGGGKGARGKGVEGGGGRVGRKLDLNEEVRDRIDDIKTPSVNRGVVNLTITTDASALFPAFDSQVVKEIVGVRGAK